jgi:hypothetical protein
MGLAGEMGFDRVSRSAASLAADPAFVGDYAPIVTSFRIPAIRFSLAVGSPSFSSVNSRVGAWALDATADERVVAPFEVPSGWATLTVDFIVANLTADAGDVRWALDFGEFADGDNLNITLPTSQATVVTALGQYIMDVATVSTAPVACTPGKQQILRVSRTGSSGSDTKAGDAAFVSAVINKAS